MLYRKPRLCFGGMYAFRLYLQGDLTDPLYFDYISYAQYVVIGREMKNGLQLFQVRRKKYIVTV